MKLEAIFLTVLALVAVLSINAVSADAPQETTCEPTTLATTEETTETVAESTEAEVPTEPSTEPTVILYDVPLDEELQLHIISEADKVGIDPAIIFAMAFRESTYRADAIGDGGNSYGLLQVQPRWHSARMERLGCTDLLDPFQNVTVAVDYLAEQIARYGDLAKGLTAYNRGDYEGTVTEYALSVMAKAEELR